MTPPVPLRPTQRYRPPAPRGGSAATYGILAGLLAAAAIPTILATGDAIIGVFDATDIPGALPDRPETSGPDCAPDGEVRLGHAGSDLRAHLNVWNPDANGVPGSDKSFCLAPVRADAPPTPQRPWSWSWEVPGGGNAVTAYPGVVHGHSPWHGHGAAPSSVSVAESDITARYAYRIEASGTYNAALEVWLTDDGTPAPAHITEEVMIWTERSGMHPAGTLVGDDLLIDGRRFDLHAASSHTDISGSVAADWAYFAFVAQSPVRAATLDVSAFLDHLVSAGHVPASRHVSSVEFGTEIVAGHGQAHLEAFRINGLDDAPVSVQFPATRMSWNDPALTVSSSYRDLPGLGATPVPFTVSGGAGSVATANTDTGQAAAAGTLTWGTALRTDAPLPGERHVLTLTAGDVVASWEVTRDPIPPERTFRLTRQEDTWAQIVFSDIGMPALRHPFSVAGTGTTNPRAVSVHDGTPRAGVTENWGLTLVYDQPAAGMTDVISLEIAGQRLDWTVSGP